MMCSNATKLTLVCLLAASLLPGCRKNEGQKPARVSYTAKMGGTRNWRGSHYYHAEGIHFPTPIHESWEIPDTSITITIVNDTAIQFAGEVYPYDRTDSGKQVHYFAQAYYYYTIDRSGGIAYFYNGDSIVHCMRDLHGTSDFWDRRDILHTY